MWVLIKNLMMPLGFICLLGIRVDGDNGTLVEEREQKFRTHIVFSSQMCSIDLDTKNHRFNIIFIWRCSYPFRGIIVPP